MESLSEGKKSELNKEYKDMETSKESPWEGARADLRGVESFFELNRDPIFKLHSNSEATTFLERSTALLDRAFWFPSPPSSPPKPSLNTQEKTVKRMNLHDPSDIVEETYQSQILWMDRLRSGSDKPVEASPRRAVLSPEGPSYGFCVVPSLAKPDPPTLVPYEPISQPDRVYISEDGTTVKVVKLEEPPKEKKFITVRKKRETTKLVDTNVKPELEVEKTKMKKLANSSTSTSPKKDKVTGFKHSLPATNARQSVRPSSRKVPTVEKTPCDAEVPKSKGLEESSLDLALKETLNHLKEELGNKSVENSDQGDKENKSFWGGPVRHSQSPLKKPRIPLPPESKIPETRRPLPNANLKEHAGPSCWVDEMAKSKAESVSRGSDELSDPSKAFLDLALKDSLDQLYEELGNKSSVKENHSNKENSKILNREPCSPIKKFWILGTPDEKDSSKLHNKNSRNYDPQVVQEYMKKKRAERTDTQQKDHNKKMKEMMEKKKKLRELREVQLKALKSCVKRTNDNEPNARPEWVGILDNNKDDSESEGNGPKGFGVLSKSAKPAAFYSRPGQKIQDVRAAIIKKKKAFDSSLQACTQINQVEPSPNPLPEALNDPENTHTEYSKDSGNTQQGRSKYPLNVLPESSPILTHPRSGSPKDPADPLPGSSKDSQPTEHGIGDKKEGEEIIKRLSDQVEELTKNLQTIKNLKRSGTPPKTIEAAIQVSHSPSMCCPIHKRQRLSSSTVKKKSTGVQVAVQVTSKPEAERVPNEAYRSKSCKYFQCTETEVGRAIQKNLDESIGHSQPMNLARAIRKQLNYYNQLREQYKRNGNCFFSSPNNPPLGVDELKLDFPRNSEESSSRSELSAHKDLGSSSDKHLKSDIAPLTLTSDSKLEPSTYWKENVNRNYNEATSLSSGQTPCGMNTTEAYIDLEQFKIDKKSANSIFEPVKNWVEESGASADSNKSLLPFSDTQLNPQIVKEKSRREMNQRLEMNQSHLSQIFDTSMKCNISNVSPMLCPESGHNNFSIKSNTTMKSDFIKASSDIWPQGSPSSSTSSLQTLLDSVKGSVELLTSAEVSSPVKVKSRTESEIMTDSSNLNTILKSAVPDKSGTSASSPSTTKSDSSITECLSVDPLKLPSSIGMLKLFRQVVQGENVLEDASLKYSHSEPALSKSLKSAEKKMDAENVSKILSSSLSNVLTMPPFGIQNSVAMDISGASNNTATLNSLSLRNRFKDEIKRLDTLNISLNKAISRNKTSSSDIATMFQKKLDTISVTKTVEQSTSEMVEGFHARDSEFSTVSIHNSVTLSMSDSSFLDHLQIPDNIRSNGVTESSEGSDVSISGISSQMLAELTKDEDQRLKHQTTLLKLRGKALFDRTTNELKLLELQKRKARGMGNEEMIKNIRKKQRGVVLKHQDNLDEIKSLMKAEKLASKERKQLFWHQLQMANLHVMSRRSPKKHNIEPNKFTKMALMDSSFESGKAHSSSPQKEWSRLYLEKQKRLLDEREASLAARHDAIDVLMSFKNRLEQEEKRVKELEKQAVRQVVNVSCERTDRGTSPLYVRRQSESMLSTRPKSLTSNSSVPEDLPSQQPSHSETEEYSYSSKPTDYGSDCSKLSSAVSEQFVSTCFSNNDKGCLSGDEKWRHSVIAIKTPLSPRVSRTQRHQSSGSDESVMFSQNDTLSEHSNTEVRVCALQQQLKQRKIELERLKRERSKTQLERLRAKEQSLINQIQAYDTYIEQVKSDIKKELDASDVRVMRPQIKQPKVGERRKSDVGPIDRRREDFEASSLETAQESVQTSESNSNISHTVNENEQESSEGTVSVKTLLESSSLPPVEEEIKNKSSSQSSFVETTSAQAASVISNDIGVKLKDFESEGENFSEPAAPSETIEMDIAASKDIQQVLELEASEHTVAIDTIEFTQQNNSTTSKTSIISEIDASHPEINDQEQWVETISGASLQNNMIREESNNFKFSDDVTLSSGSSTLTVNNKPETIEVVKKSDVLDNSNLNSQIVILEKVSADDSISISVEEILDEIQGLDNSFANDLSILNSNNKLFCEEQESLSRQQEDEIIVNVQERSACNNLHHCEENLDSKSGKDVEEREKVANRITDDIMLNLLHESFNISQKLWKKNICRVAENCKDELDETPLLKALQEENKEGNEELRRKACETAALVSEELCGTYVEESTDMMLKAYLKRIGISPLEDELKSPDTMLDIGESLDDLDEFDIKVGENEGNWLGEEFTPHSSKEAEQLRLQQLQIEQEIEELEQATQVPFYYVREIPNKPPPPYTPPRKIPTKEEVVSRVIDGISTLWSIGEDPGTDLATVDMPDDYLTHVDDRSCRQFMFDLAKELFLQYRDRRDDESVPPWMRVVPRRRLRPPIRTKEDLIKIIERQVKVIFGFEPKAQKENLIIRWAPKKRDHVDELLVRECQEEESEWTDFSEEENIVKNEVAEIIIDNMLQAAVDSLISAFNKKFSQESS